MATQDKEDRQLVDPDPFIIINMVIAAVAALGTIGQAYVAFIAYKRPDPVQATSDRHNGIEDLLRRQLIDAIFETESLIRFLARLGSFHEPVLEAEFKYGNTQLLLARDEFDNFARLSDRLSKTAGFIQSSVLSLLRYHPQRAEELGAIMGLEGLSAVDRVNQYYRGQLTTGQVLESALEMLKSYQMLLGRMDRAN